jgi:hypothetical protein
MADPINTWDHVIPEGRGEYESASWSQLSLVFGDDFDRYFLAAYALVVLDENGHLTGRPHERVGARLWALAHGVAELDDFMTPSLDEFGARQRENFERFRDFIYVSLGQAHPLGLLELLDFRGLPKPREWMLAYMNHYVTKPAWERWLEEYREAKAGGNALFGGEAA